MSLASVIDLFLAYQRTAAVKAGVELDVFTAIAEGVDSAGGLAVRCQAEERGVRILCDYLTVVGLLRMLSPPTRQRSWIGARLRTSGRW